MRVVYMGTPDFSATILEELAAHHEVAAVYTRPDAVRGRGKKLVPSSVKELAERLGLPVLTPRTLRDEAVQAELASFEPEAICVAAYGALLPREVLELPPHGCLNVHGSLLPRWRGAAPIERAILAGDPETGVSIMEMEEGLDTGPYCVQRSIPIAGLRAPVLTDELAVLGVRALLTALELVEAGQAHWIAQADEAAVTYASKLEKGELDLAPELPAAQNVRRAQAASAAHPARCLIGGRAVSVEAALLACDGAEPVDPEASLPYRREEAAKLPQGLAPGQAAFVGGRLYLGCAPAAQASPEAPQGLLEVVEVKPDGKRALEAAAFAAGLPAQREGLACWEAVAR